LGDFVTQLRLHVMPPLGDFAITCSLAAIQPSLIGKNIRVAGKILSYDPITHLLLLAHHPYGILVDMNLCLDPSQSLHYLRENKGTLMILGPLEHTETPLEVPLLSRFVEAPSLDDHLVLRAIVARSMNDLSLDRWCTGIEATKQGARTS